ncbi:MBG domain-containing protein [Flavobacterium ginsenosidimutans]|uniref:MBG domain-containing protein n=1 Tax=Flavobacterium ginsenosidimutans TaxID=687844 RepID=UPI003D99A759
MKKLYLLITLLFFAIQHINAQTFTETFESATADVANFTSNGKTFNLTSPFDFKVFSFPGLGYNASSSFIQVSDPLLPGAMGQTGVITAASGSFKVSSFWFYVSGNAEVDPGVTNGGGPGSITFRGKLAGSTVFTVVRNTTGADTGFGLPGNGFTLVNFATEGGSNNTNQIIDQLEIQLSSNYDYFAIDNFTFANAVTTPTVTTNTPVTNFGAVTATLGGSNTDGGDTVLNRGIVWSLTTNPVINGAGVTQVAGTAGPGAFTIPVNSLPSGTTIYYRAYATNSAGTGYGNTVSFVTNAALSATQSQTVACNGTNNGTATVIPSGGKAPYTFLWSNGTSAATAINLAPTNYSVLITDSEGTSISKNFTIAQNSAISGSTTISNVSCNGGNNGYIDLTPTGGSGTYTYNWGGGVTTQDRVTLAAGTYSVTITDSNNCSTTISNIVVGQPAAVLNGTTNVTTVACNGGSTGAIDLTPSGGTGPYTFLWNDGITTEDRTGIPVGSYSVTITDANSCTKTINGILVTQPPLISTVATLTHIACFGGNTGSIVLAPSGGVGGYSYLWNDGITTQNRTGLAAGTYNVTITDSNNCSRPFSYTLNQPNTALGGNVNVSNASCNGGSNGSLDLTPSGGTPGYTYSWSDGPTTQDRTGLIAGTYSVTIRDANNCSFTISNIIVGQPATALSALTGGGQTDVSCNGGANGTATVAPTGGTPGYTYSWAPTGGTAATATGLIAGTYTVTVTDANGCQATRSYTIGQPASAISLLTGASKTDVACRGGNNGTAMVTPTGGTGAYTYSWAPSGGTAAIATGLAAGTYTVTVTDANGCQAFRTFVIAQPASVLSVVAGGGQTDVSCYGGANGTATVAPTGGTPGYTYSWNTNPAQTTATASGLAAGNYTVTVTDANGCQTTRNYIIGQPTGPLSALTGGSQTDVSCNGGSNGTATVAPTGGTPGYTYSWAPSGGTGATASGLAAGTYTVTVTDANACQTTRTFTIGEPTILSATKSKMDALCNGSATGSATVTVSGGTPGYTYLWSPSGGTAATATGLASGNYSCLITDNNGCSVTETFFIDQPSALAASTAYTNATCSTGGNATVFPIGGAGGYSYLWTPGNETTSSINNIAAGNYTCVITDANGCSISKVFTIGTTNTLVAATAQTDLLCNGENTGSASVIPSGAAGPFTYIWSPSGGSADTATNLAAGNYSVTITASNGCSIVKNFTINQPPAIVITKTGQTDVSCFSGSNGSLSVNVTGGTGAYTYSWAPSGGTAATASGLSAGNYVVTVSDANGCVKTENYTITEPATITPSITKTDVSCNGGSNGSATVSVTGGTGAYTYSWAPSGGTGATASGLLAGTYIVTITDANLCQTTESVTIDEPAILTASIAKTDVLCNQANNGTATVTANGGTGAYTYSWAPSGGTAAIATGLSPNTYTVTVTDSNGCFITETVQITEPTVLSAVDSQINVSCNGGNDGTASVAVSGGTGTYTYLWAPFGGTAATATGLTAGTYTVTITDANSCSVVNTITITEPDALALTTTSTDVSCNTGANGSATVNATGGTGAYTYSWAPYGGTAATATGLSAGNYTVTVTDTNSCSANANVIINEPTALTTSISKTDVSCNGGSNGSATVTTTGGTGVYTYLWAPSGGTDATASGLIAGTYTVTVTDANSCLITETVTIDEPTALTASTTKTDVLCDQANNGTATVTASGGTGTYTYLWAPSGGTAATATGLSPDTYTVTVTDANGCFITETIQITEPAPLSVADSQTNVSCHGGNDGTALVTATGGTGTYTYSWAPSGGTAAAATGLSAGTYTVSITDSNSCSIDKTITITEPDSLTLTTTVTDVSCNGGSNGSATVTTTGGTGAYTYLWAPSGGTDATASGLVPGNYTVTVTDANGCFTTETVQITEPDVLSATYTQTNVSCHGGSDAAASVTATGGTGTYTYLWSPSGGTAATATNLSAGTYTVTVTDSNLCSTVNTITITEPDALTLVTAVTQVSCHGGNNGSAIVYPSGGSDSYTFLWSPSGGTSAIATGLSPGTYSVIVTDANSCAATIDVVITEPANPVNLNTSAVSGITATGASLSGSVSSDGINTDTGECLTEAGFVYALHENPTTADTKINVTSALETFTSSLTGLRGNRTYYVRTYAVNSNGFINYGNEVSFTTQKYTLTITADAGQTKVYGTTDPVFDYKYLGLANGDAPSIITGLLSRDAGENVGTYNIKLGTINAGTDYIIVFSGAEFEITKADQTITWNQTLEFGCSDSNSLTLNATTDSGLPVSYTVANPAIATISGTTLNVTGSGSTTITAVQNGDQNHNAAESVIKTIEISQSGLVVQQWANVLFFDNRSNSYVAWQWYKNGVTISGATRQYYSELQPLNGTYHVIAKDKNGNSIKSCPIETTGTVFTKKIKIYPNPVKPGATFTLECDFSESQLNGAEVTIFDITGKLVQTVSNVTATNQITAPTQAALYIVVLKLANGQIKTINLLVK